MNMTFSEFISWQKGASKNMQMHIALNGDLIATIINMFSTGNKVYTRDDIYTVNRPQTTDFERILREHFGGNLNG